MFCSNCGHNVGSEDRFCSECGYSLKETAVNKNKFPLQLLSIPLLIIIVVVVVMVFEVSPKKNTYSSPEEVVDAFYKALLQKNVKQAFSLYDPFMINELDLRDKLDASVPFFTEILEEQTLIEYDIGNKYMLSDNQAIVELTAVIRMRADMNQAQPQFIPSEKKGAGI